MREESYFQKMIMKRIFSLFIITFVCQKLFAQHSLEQVLQMQSLPKLYQAHKINSLIQIDGKDDDKVWKIANWSDEFVDIEGANKAKPKYNTKVKMLWDDQHLYIYAKMDEPHIWGTLNQHDAIIYHDNDFEVFIKPNIHQAPYYEIEINTFNTIMDLMMPKPYRFGGQAIMHWDAKNIKSAIHIEGTNNNSSDIDKYWSVEMAIPFQSLANFATAITPKTNSYWRLNFSRVQWKHDIVDGHYTRKRENGKYLPEDNWVWSPIGLINMHYPERWGYLQFVEGKSEEYKFPNSYALERITWNIHYFQKLHFDRHHQYSSTLENLKPYLQHIDMQWDDFDYQFTLNRDQSFYQIEIKDLHHKLISTIDSHGHYHLRHE